MRVHFLASVSVDFCLKAGPSASESEAYVVGMNSFVNSRVPRGDATPDGPPHACSGVATPGLRLNHTLEVGRVRMSLTFSCDLAFGGWSLSSAAAKLFGCHGDCFGEGKKKL